MQMKAREVQVWRRLRRGRHKGLSRLRRARPSTIVTANLKPSSRKTCIKSALKVPGLPSGKAKIGKAWPISRAITLLRFTNLAARLIERDVAENRVRMRMRGDGHALAGQRAQLIPVERGVIGRAPRQARRSRKAIPPRGAPGRKATL